MAEFGYAGKILKIDLSSGKTQEVPTSDYADKFLGGRGIAAKIYWDETPPEAGPFDGENRLLFATGPLAGFTGLGCSRWEMWGKSPSSDVPLFNNGNLGGNWGLGLKAAGYDALSVHGKADKPVYLVIQDGTVQVKDASSLWGKGAAVTRGTLKEQFGKAMKVVATGPAGENLVSMATPLADDDAVACGGFGAVMGSKNLKAIVVGGSGKVTAAHPEKLRELAKHFRELLKGKPESFEDALPSLKPDTSRLKKMTCLGCIGCGRQSYRAQDGQEGKFICHSAMVYQLRAERYYGEKSDRGFHATRMCDDYGLDTDAIDVMITWLSRCYRAGILTDDSTGMPLSKIGSMEFFEILMKKISFREGFGDVLARGTIPAADSISTEARGVLGDLIHTGGHDGMFNARLYNTHAIIYAMEPRKSIEQLHEISRINGKWMDWVHKKDGAFVNSDVYRAIAKRFWGSELAADFSTYEGKAQAALKVQDREYAKECMVACDSLWPVSVVSSSKDHVGDPTLESQAISAVTGKEMDEDGFYRLGERGFNLRRAILAREGHRGRDSDRLPEFEFDRPLTHHFVSPDMQVPGKDGEIISKKGNTVNKKDFENLMTEYYQLRGWDAVTGLQTVSKLRELGLPEVAADLKPRGLAK